MEPGIYTLQENQFIAGGNKYCLKVRKAVSITKPQRYIIQVSPIFRYVSSLYPVSGSHNTYTLDIDNRLYVLQVLDSQVSLFVEPVKHCT